MSNSPHAPLPFTGHGRAAGARPVGPTGHAAFFKHSHVKRLLDEALDSASPLPTLASGGRSEKELCAWAQQHGAATVEQVVSRWVERFSHLGACLSDYGAMSRLENVKAGTPEERLAADILRLACHIGGARAVLRDDPSTGRGKDERWKAAQVRQWAWRQPAATAWS